MTKIGPWWLAWIGYVVLLLALFALLLSVDSNMSRLMTEGCVPGTVRTHMSFPVGGGPDPSPIPAYTCVTWRDAGDALPVVLILALVPLIVGSGIAALHRRNRR